MTRKLDCASLREKAVQIRQDVVKMIYCAGSGHPGGSLSFVDLIVTLYFYKLTHKAQDPDWAGRDRFVLSKGHGCPSLYATLAHAGYFSRDELWTLRKLGSRLQGHPQRDLPGVEISSGSLGQGLSVANGIALGLRMNGQNNKVYCLMGDGEIQEGQIWEAALTAAHHKLSNLCGIVDCNGLQIDGLVKDVKNIEPLADKWRAFGWHVIEVDGHNVEEIAAAYDTVDTVNDRPSMIIARTVKGKGVSFMEGVNKWHGVAPKEEEYHTAQNELQGESS